jgi:isocitrate dehydrogenase kinase/phosphatase
MMAYFVLMAEPYDFEDTAAGDPIRHVLWDIYPEQDWPRMIEHVLHELRLRWPGYAIEKDVRERDFSIHQKTGQAVATVAIIARSLP